MAILNDGYFCRCIGHAPGVTDAVVSILRVLDDPLASASELDHAAEELSRCDVWTRLYAAEPVVRRWMSGEFPPSSRDSVEALLEVQVPDLGRGVWTRLLEAVLGQVRPRRLSAPLEECARDVLAATAAGKESLVQTGAGPYLDLVEHRAATFVMAVLEAQRERGGPWLASVLGNTEDAGGEISALELLTGEVLDHQHGRTAFVYATRICEGIAALPEDMESRLWQISDDALLEPDLLDVASRILLPRTDATDRRAWLQLLHSEARSLGRLSELADRCRWDDAHAEHLLDRLQMPTSQRLLAFRRGETIVAMWQGTLWSRMAGEGTSVGGEVVGSDELLDVGRLLDEAWCPPESEPWGGDLAVEDAPRPKSTLDLLLRSAIGLRVPESKGSRLKGYTVDADDDTFTQSNRCLTSPWLAAGKPKYWDKGARRYRGLANTAAVLRLVVATRVAADWLARISEPVVLPPTPTLLLLHATDALRLFGFRFARSAETPLGGMLQSVLRRTHSVATGEQSQLDPEHFQGRTTGGRPLDDELFRRAAPASALFWIAERYSQVTTEERGAGRWFEHIESLVSEQRTVDPRDFVEKEQLVPALLMRFLVPVRDPSRYVHLDWRRGGRRHAKQRPPYHWNQNPRLYLLTPGLSKEAWGLEDWREPRGNWAASIRLDRAIERFAVLEAEDIAGDHDWASDWLTALESQPHPERLDRFVRLRLVELVDLPSLQDDGRSLENLVAWVLETGWAFELSKLMETLYSNPEEGTRARFEVALSALPRIVEIALAPVVRPDSSQPRSPDHHVGPINRRRIAHNWLTRIAGWREGVRALALRERLDTACKEQRQRYERGQQVLPFRVEHRDGVAELQPLRTRGGARLDFPELLAATTVDRRGLARVAVRDFAIPPGVNSGFEYDNPERWSELQGWSDYAGIVVEKTDGPSGTLFAIRVGSGAVADPKTLPDDTPPVDVGSRVRVGVQAYPNQSGPRVLLNRMGIRPLPLRWPTGLDTDAQLSVSRMENGVPAAELELPGGTPVPVQSEDWILDPAGVPHEPMVLGVVARRDTSGDWLPAPRDHVSLLLDWPLGEDTLGVVYLGSDHEQVEEVVHRFGYGAGRIYDLRHGELGERLRNDLSSESGLPPLSRIRLVLAARATDSAGPAIERTDDGPDLGLRRWRALFEAGETRVAQLRDSTWVVPLEQDEIVEGLPDCVVFEGSERRRFGQGVTQAGVRIESWDPFAANARGSFVETSGLRLGRVTHPGRFAAWWDQLERGEILEEVRLAGGVQPPRGANDKAGVRVQAWTWENLHFLVESDSVQLSPMQLVDKSIARSAIVGRVDEWARIEVALAPRCARLTAAEAELPWLLEEGESAVGILTRVPETISEVSLWKVLWFRRNGDDVEGVESDLQVRGLAVRRRSYIHPGSRIVAEISPETGVVQVSVYTRRVFIRLLWREAESGLQENGRSWSWPGTDQPDRATPQFSVVEQGPGLFVREPDVCDEGERARMRLMNGRHFDPQVRVHRQTAYVVHRRGRAERLEPGFIELARGRDPHDGRRDGDFDIHPLVRVRQVCDGLYDLSKRFVRVERVVRSHGRKHKDTGSAKQGAGKGTLDRAHALDPLRKVLRDRTPQKCTWEPGQAHVEIVGLDPVVKEPGTRNGVSLTPGHEPYVERTGKRQAGWVMLSGHPGERLEASFRRVPADSAADFRKRLGSPRSGGVVALDDEGNSGGSLDLAYVGLAQHDDATGELFESAPVHRFEWGPGYTLVVPERDLRFGDESFGDVTNSLFHGDRIRELIFHEIEDEPPPDRQDDEPPPEDRQDDEPPRLCVEIRRVRLQFAESTRLYNQRVRHRIVHLLEVERLRDSLQIVSIRGFDGGAVRPRSAARRYSVPRAVLSDSSAEVLRDRIRPGERAQLFGRLLRSEFEESHGRTVRFEHVNLDANSTSVSTLRPGERVFLRLSQIERPHNEVKVHFEPPDLLRGDEPSTTVVVLRREFSVREGLLRQVIDRKADAEIEGRLMLVKIGSISGDNIRGYIWEDDDVIPLHRRRSSQHYQGGQAGRSLLPLRSQRSLLGHLKHLEGWQLMAVAADHRDTGGVLVVEVMPGIHAQMTGERVDAPPPGSLSKGDVVHVRRVLGADGAPRIAVELAVRGDVDFLPEDGRTAVLLPVDRFAKNDIIAKARHPWFWEGKDLIVLGGLPGITARLGRFNRGSNRWVSLFPAEGKDLLSRGPVRVGYVGWDQGEPRVDPTLRAPGAVGRLDIKDDGRLVSVGATEDGERPLSWRLATFQEAPASAVAQRIRQRGWWFHDRTTVQWSDSDQGISAYRPRLAEVDATTGPVFFEWVDGPVLRYSPRSVGGFGYPAHQLIGELPQRDSVEVTVAHTPPATTRFWVETSPGRVVSLPPRLLVAQLSERQPLSLEGAEVMAFATGDVLRLGRVKEDALALDRVRLDGWEPSLRGLLGGRQALLQVMESSSEEGYIRLGTDRSSMVLPLCPEQAERLRDHRIALIQPDNTLKTLAPDDEFDSKDLNRTSALLTRDDQGLLVAGLEDYRVVWERAEEAWCGHPLSVALQEDTETVLAACGGSLPITIELLYQPDQVVYVSLRNQAPPRDGLLGTAPAKVLGRLGPASWLLRVGRYLLPAGASDICGGVPGGRIANAVVRELSSRGNLPLWVRQEGDRLVSGLRPHSRDDGPAKLTAIVRSAESRLPLGFVVQDPSTLSLHWMHANKASWTPRLTQDSEAATALLQDHEGWVRGAFVGEGTNGQFSIVDYPAARSEFHRLTVGQALNLKTAARLGPDPQGRVLAKSVVSGVWLDYWSDGQGDLPEEGIGAVVGLRDRGNRPCIEAIAGDTKGDLILPPDLARLILDPDSALPPGICDAQDLIDSYTRAATGDGEDEWRQAKTRLDELGLRSVRSMHLEILADLWILDEDARERRDGLWGRLATLFDDLFVGDPADVSGETRDRIRAVCNAIQSRSALSRDDQVAAIGAALEMVLGDVPSELKLLREYASMNTEILRLTQLEPPEPTAWPLVPSKSVRAGLATVRSGLRRRRLDGYSRVLLLPPLARFGAAVAGR